MATQVVVVDVETSGRDPKQHTVVECAYWNLATGERATFVPEHLPAMVLRHAEIRALQVNRYIDRLATAPQDRDQAEVIRLWEQFGGPLSAGYDEDAEPQPRPVLAAVNPAFDAAFLSKLFDEQLPRELCLDSAPWHYRMRDLGSYAAGALGLPLDADPLSLRDVCERLDIEPGDHTAAGDVRATGECFLALAQLSAQVHTLAGTGQ